MQQNETRAGMVLLAVSVGGGIVDDELRKQLDGLKPDDWAPAELMARFIRGIEAEDPTRVKTIGRAIMYAGKTTFLKPFMPLVPKNLLRVLDEMYRANNRGPSIAYWRAVSMEEGKAVVETTENYGEYFAEGVLNGLFRVAGAKNVAIEKRRARSRGDAADEFVVTWED
ncbi:hypothetical protein ACFL5O_07265 [Myxococcota bacterium]